MRVTFNEARQQCLAVHLEHLCSCRADLRRRTGSCDLVVVDQHCPTGVHLVPVKNCIGAQQDCLSRCGCHGECQSDDSLGIRREHLWEAVRFAGGYKWETRSFPTANAVKSGGNSQRTRYISKWKVKRRDSRSAPTLCASAMRS